MSFLLFDGLPVRRGGLLGLVGAGLVVAAIQKVVGEVLLLHVVIRVVVGVLVALEQGALEVDGNIHAPSGLHVLHGGVEREVGGVGLGSGSQQEGGVDEGDTPLGHTQLPGRLTAGADDGGGLGVGQADVLRGDDLEAAHEGEHIPRSQHFGHVEGGGVGVGAADGFLQASQQVIVGVLVEVAHTRAEGGDMLVGDLGTRLKAGGEVGVLQKSYGAADVASRSLGQAQSHLVREDGGGAALGIEMIQGAAEHLEALGGRDGLEFKEGGAGDNGVVDVEMGVFGGGGDEGDAAVLHVLQKGLLLLTVEVLDLVQVEQDAARSEHALGLRQDVFYVLQGGCRRVELVEFHTRLRRDDRGGGGLSRTGRAVEDHICYSAGVQHFSYDATFSEQMLLTYYLVKALGSQSLGSAYGIHFRLSL